MPSDSDVTTRLSPSLDENESREAVVRAVGPSRFLWIVLPYAIYIGFTTNGGASLLLRRAGLSVGLDRQAQP